MYILHAIENYPTDLFETFIRTHDANGVPLHENIALRQEFDGLSEDISRGVYTAKVN